jgi:type II secretory pathway pseudopilin PulG
MKQPCAELRWSVLLLGLLLTTGLPVAAQEDPRAKDIEALRATMQQLETSLQEARTKLSELEQPPGSAVVTNQAAPPPTTTGDTNLHSLTIGEKKILLPAPFAELGLIERSLITDHDTVGDQQLAAPRPNNATIDPALKGFIPIPGAQTMIRFGGSARLDVIADAEDNGNPNQFVPSSIPVPGQAGFDGGPRSTIHAKATRVTFEARRPVGEEGQLRIYNENDFFDDSTSGAMKFRVRHFYGQAWNVLAGQTFSAFMNVDAFPDTLDYAGPNAMINKRQAQLRYSPPIYDGAGKMHLLFSLEQPESDLNPAPPGPPTLPVGAKTVSRTPDGVVGWRWEGDVGHVQVSGLFRCIGYEADNAPDDSVFGWGINASGVFKVFAADKFLWQFAYGEGMARYVNDIGSADLDAAPDSTGQLQAIPVGAAMLGYTHEWSPQFRSTASVGYIYVEPEASLGGFAIEDTEYASVNLVWHPTKSFRMGLEYLVGSKETQGGGDRDGHRLNFVIRYDLIR